MIITCENGTWRWPFLHKECSAIAADVLKRQPCNLVFGCTGVKLCISAFWDFLPVHSKRSSFLEIFTFHFNGARTATQQLSSMEPDLSTIPIIPKLPQYTLSAWSVRFWRIFRRALGWSKRDHGRQLHKHGKRCEHGQWREPRIRWF